MSELVPPFDPARDHWRGGEGAALFLNGRLHRDGYDHGTLRATLDSLEAT